MMNSWQRRSIDYAIVIALVIFGLVVLAMLLSTGSALLAQQTPPHRTSVCRHRPVGKHRPFDAKASAGAWDRFLGRIQRRIPIRSIEPRRPKRGHEAGAYSSGLRAGSVSTGTVKPTAAIPRQWVGRTIVFASASRLARSAAPKDATIVLTRWRSDRELRSAMERLANHRVLVGGRDLVELMRVTSDETIVKVISQNKLTRKRF